ncbi:hypothetical protein KGD83_03070 [Nocardiopsis akebiae]|uniref:Htaa domain-containing protein n=1 Tax=Nocardiopsis akebiae TaxID=2831968 RepID=A0ABX8C610_9ACTN|nr:hypothetical protein KGD83_03070 [Nocardiopsis akebiae]
MVSPAKLTARRLVRGGVLFAALGVLGAVPALPASADQLVWGNAQAWVADGDVVTGYSTATGFGGETEGSATAEDLFGPMAPYLEIDGESHTVVDADSARAASTVRTASFRMEVADLAARGLIDVPPEVDLPEPSVSASPSPEAEPPSEGTPFRDEPSPDGDGADGTGGGTGGTGDTGGADDRTPSGGDPADGGAANEGSGDGGDTPADTGDQEAAQASEEPSDAPRNEPQESASPSPSSLSSPSGSSSPSPSAAGDVLLLDGAVAETVSADGNAVEFTLADVTATATAGYDGVTETTFAHGDLTAFGVSAGPLGKNADGTVVEEVLEVFDEDGDVALEVPVRIRFEANETTFRDQDEDWDGRGGRSWMTVWVQVGEVGQERGFAVDFADAWALGSTYAATTPPSPGDKGDPEEESPRPEEVAGDDNRLATTGSSLAALITAAVVAVGGGAAATFLARDRTTAMDDRIEDF